MTEPMRIARALALSGIDSRRKCESYIERGEVEVNGEVIRNLATRVDIEKDVLAFRGRIIQFEKHVYYLLNKPVGYTTTARDPYAKKTVFELLPRKLVTRSLKGRDSQVRVFPVGRLDRDSSGLLMFTNDGGLANQLIHPRYGVDKVYEVRLNRAFEMKDKAKILRGVRLKDGVAKVEKVMTRSRRVVRVMIREGKKREVRRIFGALEYGVVALCRLSFGPFVLGDLRPGQGRFLTQKEIKKLQKDNKR